MLSIPTRGRPRGCTTAVQSACRLGRPKRRNLPPPLLLSNVAAEVEERAALAVPPHHVTVLVERVDLAPPVQDQQVDATCLGHLAGVATSWGASFHKASEPAASKLSGLRPTPEGQTTNAGCLRVVFAADCSSRYLDAMHGRGTGRSSRIRTGQQRRYVSMPIGKMGDHTEAPLSHRKAASWWLGVRERARKVQSAGP